MAIAFGWRRTSTSEGAGEGGRGGGKEGGTGQGVKDQNMRTTGTVDDWSGISAAPSFSPSKPIHSSPDTPPLPPPLLPPLLLTLPFPLPLPPFLVEAVSQDLGHAQVKLEPAQRGVPGLRKGEREGGKEGLSHDMNEQSDWKSTGAISPSILRQTSFRHRVGKALPSSLSALAPYLGPNSEMRETLLIAPPAGHVGGHLHLGGGHGKRW